MIIKRTAAMLLAFSIAGVANVGGDEPTDTATSVATLGKFDHRSLAELKLKSNQTKDDHPLLPTLRIAHDGYQRIVNDVRDYTCVMVKREYVNGRLREPEFISAKVRHEQVEQGRVVCPLSVYLKFRGPASLQDREVLFVQGRADNKLIVRNGGRRLAFLTLALDPTSAIAMSGNRYPITEFGIKRLVERMILLGKRELAYDECVVEIRDDVSLDQHVCTCIEVMHPIRRQHFEYHLVKIYIDNQLRVPIRFESYDWPDKVDDPPALREEYTYRDLKLNVGLTDADFQQDNPAYRFR